MTAAIASELEPELSRCGIGFEYLTADGARERAGRADAARVPFERCAPMRGFAFRKGQRHLPGRWWSATDSAHVGYESWLERDHLMLLDFDPDVVAIASQPFRLSWTTEDGPACSHIPDFFARRGDATALVIDCRPAERIKARDAATFAATKQVCEQLGWDYRVSGALDPVLTGNVRWLAGYRHPRHRLMSVAAALCEAFATPTPLLSGADIVGDPVAVLPVLFHLLWRHELTADMSVPLHPDTVMMTGRPVPTGERGA